MGKAILRVSPEFLVALAQQTELSFFQVVKHPVPPDAKFCGARYISSADVLEIFIESASLRDGELVEPVFHEL